MARQRSAMSSFLAATGLAAPEAEPMLPREPDPQGRPGWLTSYAVALSKASPRLAAGLLRAARVLTRPRTA